MDRVMDNPEKVTVEVKDKEYISHIMAGPPWSPQGQVSAPGTFELDRGRNKTCNQVQQLARFLEHPEKKKRNTIYYTMHQSAPKMLEICTKSTRTATTTAPTARGIYDWTSIIRRRGLWQKILILGPEIHSLKKIGPWNVAGGDYRLPVYDR